MMRDELMRQWLLQGQVIFPGDPRSHIEGLTAMEEELVPFIVIRRLAISI